MTDTMLKFLDVIAVIDAHRVGDPECKYDRAFNDGLTAAILAVTRLEGDKTLEASLASANARVAALKEIAEADGDMI